MRIVMAKFTYVNVHLGTTFQVERGWPCRDQQDAQHIVQRHGLKTGALDAECVMEEITDEEIKQSASSTATA
jgi:hypothetical protein